MKARCRPGPFNGTSRVVSYPRAEPPDRATQALTELYLRAPDSSTVQLAHIAVFDCEVGPVQQVFDVLYGTGAEVVQTKHVVAAVEQPRAQV